MRESAGVSHADDSADAGLETHIVDAPRNAEAINHFDDLSHTSARRCELLIRCFLARVGQLKKRNGLVITMADSTGLSEKRALCATVMSWGTGWNSR